MSKIESDLPTEVLTALATACGFGISYERTPGVDEWTLSRGHGASHVQRVGTRAAVCAFLIGYADMRVLAVQLLDDLDRANRQLIVDARTRLE